MVSGLRTLLSGSQARKQMNTPTAKRDPQSISWRKDSAGESDWHSLGVEETLDRLGTSEDGLKAAEAQRRLSVYGQNALDLKQERRLLRILAGQFTDFMILVLIAGAIISGIIGDLKDAIVIAA